MQLFARSIVMGLGIALGILVIAAATFTGLGVMESRDRQARAAVAATATYGAELHRREIAATAEVMNARQLATIERQMELSAPPPEACVIAVRQGLPCATPTARR